MEMFELDVTPTLSSTVVKANLSNFVNEARTLTDELHHQILKQQAVNDDFDSEDENCPSVSNPVIESVNRLKTLTDRLEDSTFLIIACFEMANARIAELEDAIKFKDDQINGQRQHIAVLSTNQSQWSETDPELLSLRRSHISRLDYLCKLKTDLSLEKSKNLTLMKREKQLKEEYANASLSMAIDCDRLREDYEREKAKCQMQAREIDRLKQQLSTERERNRSEGHKTNSTIHKQSLKLLQKQLRTLNITSKTNVNKSSVSKSSPSKLEFEAWKELIAAVELPKEESVADIYASISKFAEERVNRFGNDPPSISEDCPVIVID